MEIKITNLREGQWFGRGRACGTYALFNERHGETLVWNAVAGRTLVFWLSTRQMQMNPQQYILLN